MLLAVITFIYAVFAFFEIVSLKKTNKNKEMVIFCIYLFIAYAISFLLALDVKLLSFDRFVGEIITSITKE